jgi:hypothetical protein
MGAHATFSEVPARQRKLADSNALIVIRPGIVPWAGFRSVFASFGAPRIITIKIMTGRIITRKIITGKIMTTEIITEKI